MSVHGQRRSTCFVFPTEIVEMSHVRCSFDTSRTTDGVTCHCRWNRNASIRLETHTPHRIRLLMYFRISNSLLVLSPRRVLSPEWQSMGKSKGIGNEWLCTVQYADRHRTGRILRNVVRSLAHIRHQERRYELDKSSWIRFLEFFALDANEPNQEMLYCSCDVTYLIEWHSTLSPLHTNAENNGS